MKEKDINPVKDELENIVPMKAAFDHNYAKRLDGNNVKDCETRWDMVEELRKDIRNFKEKMDVAVLLFFGLLLQKFMYQYAKKYTVHWQHLNKL